MSRVFWETEKKEEIRKTYREMQCNVKVEAAKAKQRVHDG